MFTQRLMTDRTPRIENEAVARGRATKGRCRENLTARSATTIWLLKIPMLPLALVLFMFLSQSNPSFPFLLSSFLPLLLSLPHDPLNLQASIPFLPVQLFTATTNLFVLADFPFMPGKVQKWFLLLALQALFLAFHLIFFYLIVPH
ncbi:MAG: hypothetical protein J2P36_25745 [Ktedonobacteraceae bacterium]|nr:hypothetical protein [Ktedonobacteraceae bacterium]